MLRNKRLIFAILMLLILTAALALMWPQPAKAEYYGTWFAQPGTPGTADTPAAYQADVKAFNNGDVVEATRLGCVVGNGEKLSEEEEEALRTVFQNAAMVYAGDYEINKDGDLTDVVKGASGSVIDEDVFDSNAGYPYGKVGMQQFLRNEQYLMRMGDWVSDPGRNLNKDQDATGPNTYIIQGREGNDFNIDIDEDRVKEEGWDTALDGNTAALINEKAGNPFELANKLPGECNLGSVPVPDIGPFTTLFSDEAPDYLVDVLAYVPLKAADAVYDATYPSAMAYSFWTPHTERGDVMWNITTECIAEGRFSQNEVQSQCRRTDNSRQPLGYDSRNLDSGSGGEDAIYIRIARFFQWLISGTYFLILFSAATLYIIRGSGSRTLDVMKVVPRLIASVLLTIFSSYLIGTMVSFSNVLVRAIFDFSDAGQIGFINNVVSFSNSVGGSGEFVGTITSIFVTLPIALFVFMLAVLSLLRGAALIGFIIFAPVAAFCLIIDAWRPLFQKYIRGLFFVIFIPPILALILKVLLAVNPLILDPSTTFGTTMGFIGLLMVAFTMWLLVKALRMALGVAFNSSAMAGSGSVLGSGAGALANRIRPDSDEDGFKAWMRRQSARGLGGVAAAGAAGSGLARLVPPEKVMGATTPGGIGAAAATGALGGGWIDKGTRKAPDAGSAMTSWMQQKLSKKTHKNMAKTPAARALNTNEVSQYDQLARTVAASRGVSSAEWQRMKFDEKADYYAEAVGDAATFKQARDGTVYMEQKEQVVEKTAANARQMGHAMATGDYAALAAAQQGGGYGSAPVPSAPAPSARPSVPQSGAGIDASGAPVGGAPTHSISGVQNPNISSDVDKVDEIERSMGVTDHSNEAASEAAQAQAQSMDRLEHLNEEQLKETQKVSRETRRHRQTTQQKNERIEHEDAARQRRASRRLDRSNQ